VTARTRIVPAEEIAEKGSLCAEDYIPTQEDELEVLKQGVDLLADTVGYRTLKHFKYSREWFDGLILKVRRLKGNEEDARRRLAIINRALSGEDMGT
jgi:hypothetical protein